LAGLPISCLGCIACGVPEDLEIGIHTDCIAVNAEPELPVTTTFIKGDQGFRGHIEAELL
jgi:hypothetical protein